MEQKQEAAERLQKLANRVQRAERIVTIYLDAVGSFITKAGDELAALDAIQAEMRKIAEELGKPRKPAPN